MKKKSWLNLVASLPTIKILSLEDTLDFRERWRSQFTTQSIAIKRHLNMHTNCPSCSKNAFDWHFFSHKNTKPADSLYQVFRKLTPQKEPLMLFSEPCHLSGIQIWHLDVLENLEILKAACSDFYVSNLSLSWTMIHTHEEGLGLGPYFLSVSSGS